MADTKNALPEGTDTIVNDIEDSGAAGRSARGGGAAATGAGAGAAIGGGDLSGGTAIAGQSGTGLREQLRGSTDRLRGEAVNRARGFVGQGLERCSGTLTNVSALIGDTASGLDERLGPEYGDYARRAAQAIERMASDIAAKDPEELVDDARDMVRRSPTVALATAAIAGFTLVRLVRSGFEQDNRQANSGADGGGDRRGGKSGARKG